MTSVLPVRSSLPRRDLPRRDGPARAQLAAVGRSAEPLVLARERALELRGELATLVPSGAIPRGVVVRVEGDPGSGATAIAFELAAAATAVGEWVGAVELDGTLGMLAARESGVALERVAVVRRVTRARWPSVVAALIEGMSLVLAEVPVGLAAADARRLVARARERGTVLAMWTGPDPRRWPTDAAFTFTALGSEWSGLELGGGVLDRRQLHLRVSGRGAAARPRRGALARAG